MPYYHKVSTNALFTFFTVFVVIAYLNPSSKNGVFALREEEQEIVNVNHHYHHHQSEHQQHRMMQQGQQQQQQEQQHAMVGGYGPIRNMDDPRTKERLQAVIDFCITSLPESTRTYTFLDTVTEQTPENLQGTIVRGYQQVVAGMNYRLIVLVQQQQQDVAEPIGAFAVTVYDRFGDMSVTSWGKEVSTTDALEMMVEKDEDNGDSESSNRLQPQDVSFLKEYFN